MGMYNDGRQLPELLQNKKCPFCGNSIETIQSKERWEVDSFDFKCKNCSPNVIISLSGSIALNIENIIKNNQNKILFYRKEIKECTNEIMYFNSSMF